ncbi:hypothetical protein EVAR_100737_1 [Eumeta japonica]|uniref:Uncharacterized protein n=1 Tax=Eumeta variegata TaxID=151549 RepID=A0A4C1ZRQ7_EUMVA|nr:hypothetical protein EVAR_100737_1 [Eumeta japonica]
MISTRTGGRRVARRKCDVAAGHSELIYARRFGRAAAAGAQGHGEGEELRIGAVPATDRKRRDESHSSTFGHNTLVFPINIPLTCAMAMAVAARE